MNTESLEELTELKEKGVLTQEEFEAEKSKLLGTETSEKLSEEVKEEKSTAKKVEREKINWKNMGLSLLLSVVFYVILITIFWLAPIDGSNANQVRLILWGGPIVVFIPLAYKFNMGKYQNCTSAFGMAVGIAMVGPIAAWIFTYDVLQIKSGLRLLKTDAIKQKTNPLAGLIWFLSLVLLVVGVVWLIDYQEKQLINYTKCDNAKAQEEQIIPLMNDSLSNFNIKALSFYDIQEKSFDSKTGSRVCNAKVNFSDGSKALVKYEFLSKNRQDYTIGFQIMEVLE